MLDRALSSLSRGSYLLVKMHNDYLTSSALDSK